jgi:hypothetical protein
MPGAKAKDFASDWAQIAKKSGLNKEGYIINNADDLMDLTMDTIEQTGFRNPEDLKNFSTGEGPLWNAAYSKAAKAGVKPVGVMDSILAGSDDSKNIIADYGDEATEYFEKVKQRLSRAKDLRGAKAVVDNEIKRAVARGQNNDMMFDAKDVLFDLKHGIDDAASEFSPELSGLIKNHKALGPVRRWLSRSESLSPGLLGGSDTMAKKITTDAIKNVTSGGAGAIGQVVAGLPGQIIGLGIGNKLNKTIPEMANFLSGENAAMVLKVLQNPKNADRIRSGVNAIRGAAGKLGTAAANVAPRLAGAAPSILSRANEEGPQEVASDKEAQAAQVSAQEAEASVAPEQAEEAKQEVNSKWADKVAENVQSAYVEYDVATLGFSYDEFLGAIKKVTNNFEPTISAEIVFPDKGERTAFLKDYERALQYKAVDVAGALDPNAGGLFGLMGPSAGQRSSRSQLTDFVARVAGQDPMLMDKKKKKAIESMVNRVAAMKGSQAEKQSALLRELQANYGIDFRRLADLGLLGVA